jgi:hypothetical protein
MKIKELKDIIANIPDDYDIHLMINVASYGVDSSIGTFSVADCNGSWVEREDNVLILLHGLPTDLEKLKG